MIKINGIELEESSVFPGGEVHIRLPDMQYIKETINYRIRNLSASLPNILVGARIRSSNDLMKLMLVKEALDENFPDVSKGVQMLYLPYARQDRACNPGEAFSAKVLASLLDSMKFNLLITSDVHSNVILSHIKTSVIHLTINDIFKTKHQPLISNMVLVAPDKGAYDKVKSLSIMLGVPFISANKIRNNGNIQVELRENIDISGKNLLIVDDICDGGGTFVALSRLLKRSNPCSINLYVTHGIFSKGLYTLREAGIKRIYTTNSIVSENLIDSDDPTFFVWEI